MNKLKFYIFYRKIVFTFLCIFIFGINSSMLLASPGYDISVNQDEKAAMVLDLKVSDFQIEETEIDGVRYSTIDFGGNITTQKKGWAKLPVINASVQISSQGSYELQIDDEEFEEYSLEYPLLPSRGVFYRDQDPSAIPYVIDDDAMVSDQWYPGERASIFEPFILRDVRGLGIRFNPFQYNASTNTLRIYTKITINLLENNENPTNELLSSQSSIIPVMDKIYGSVFLNYTSQISEDTYLEIGEMGDILVIYTSRDKSAIQPYILWKKEKGFQVHEKEVSTGTDVTNIIKDAYQTNNDILYVQLVGDWNDIKGPSTSKNEPLDPKLGQVAGSDSYADIIIGRFSAGSASKVSVQVAKSISYEKTPDLDGDWYHKALGIGGTDGPSDDESTDWGQVDAIKENRLLSSTYTEVHEAYKNPSTSQVTGPINEGLSLINYSNHGAVSNLPIGNISNSVADNMNNGKKLFFITAVACNPGEFSRDSVAEHLMNNSNGGAINVWFGSISQPWYPPYYGQDYFNDLLIGGYNYDSNPGSGINTTEGRTTFGSLAFNAGILMYTEDTSSQSKNTMESWIVFGDASLQVRTDKPKPISLSNTDIEPNGTFMTNLTSQSSPVEGALVSLYQNGNTFSALTNSSGEVSISHSLSGGSAKLVVTGFNLETKYLEVEIGSSGPTADFTASPVSGQAPLSVTFTDTSTGNLTSWNWDFGDGENSTLQNPSHVYTQEGSYSVALTVASDSDSDTKTMNNLISITDDPNPDVYCEAMADKFNYEYIQEVKLGSFTNKSQGSGYSDFTAQTISLAPGTEYSLTLTPGFANSAYNEFWRTFIDLNQDNDFDDSGEMVFEGSGIDAVTESITLPENTEQGTTRMRVTMQFNDYADPCGVFTYGEVEDYTVEVTGGGGIYCDASGTNQDYEYIKQVNIGSFSSDSGASPYSDFTSRTVVMNKDTAYTVILKPEFTGSSYSESWRIWIDLNKDGDFNDSDETVFQGAGRSDVTGSMTIPSSAIVGDTRMRVSMGYNGYPDACETISYGEVEDYTVTIQ